MVVESRRDAVLPATQAEYGAEKVYRYGKIKITVITRGI